MKPDFTGFRDGFLYCGKSMGGEARIDATVLVEALPGGDVQAVERLLPLVYDELRALAANMLRGERSDHTLQPTALVHEAYLRLVDQTRATYANRQHFIAVACRAMRRTLVDHARAKNSEKRGGRWKKIALEHAEVFAADGELDLLELNEAMNRLAELNERQVRVVELRFFGGLTIAETAYVLDVGDATVVVDWRMARAWLRRELSKWQ